MNHGPILSAGRLGWLLAALLFGILAGGGIAWLLIRPHAEPAPVVIYQVPSNVAPTPTPVTDDGISSLRRHHRTVHPAEELPAALQAAAPTPRADLAVGLDGSTATDTPTLDGRQTVLVDGIAITHPAASAKPTSTPPRRVIYDLNSAQVADSVSIAIDGISKYIQKGYSLREDTWGGELAAGRAKAITHQLFKGNDYWFGMGCSVAGSTVRVRLYDSDGNPADSNYWQHEASDGSSAAAEIQCQHTGMYFVVVSLESAPEDRVPWGVVYAYR